MRKLRKQAKELLHMASKVYHYRKDVIPEAKLAELEKSVSEVESMRMDKTVRPELFQSTMERLDGLLGEIGGKIYPKTFWNDNLEVLLVAAIIVIGFRTFFFQPFIIPTNSMYPTYNGMTHKVYTEEDASPGLVQRAFNKVRLGAKYKSLTANNDGELLIPIVPARNGKGNMVFWREQVSGRKWLFLPAIFNEYTFYVGNNAHTLQVPGDFDLSSLLSEVFDSGDAKIVRSSQSVSGFALNTGRYFKSGEPILCFNINLGDALFVDRISYHFRRPKVGDPFVFRTREIEGLGDKYYIKRLSGTSGETIEIKDGTLLVDGKPRDEANAFVLNAEKNGEYEGYVNIGLLAEDRKLTIPENNFFALGDNSDNSRDSRYWGFVPDKTVIGKAFFIYYPFTKRWGLAE